MIHYLLILAFTVAAPMIAIETRHVNSNTNIVNVTGQPPVIIKQQIPTPPPGHVYSEIKQSYRGSTNYLSSIIEALTSWNLKKAAITAGVIGALSYGAAYCKLLYDAHGIAHKESWSTWKEHIPVEIMLEVPQEEVGEELYFAIKEKYFTTDSKEAMQAVTQFQLDITAELDHLASCIKLNDFLQSTQLSIIFPDQDDVIQLARAKIKRLQYMKDVLLAWLSENSDLLVRGKEVHRSQVVTRSKRIISCS